jgi:uncharacterized protein (TIGR02569 family)
VLKPVDDEPEARWLAELTRSVRENGFRVSRPIAAADGRWIVDGWSAWSWVSGAHSATRWPELLAAAAAFHETLSGAPRPEFIDRRADRWRIAARVAWGELPWAELRDTIHLAALVAARGPVTLPAQLVHCDLTGNVLFEPGLPPAIIDLSLYWRPPEYSAALVVADAITWEGAPESTVTLIEHLTEWRQLFLRAVIFRVVVNELARRAAPPRGDVSHHYGRIVALARSVVSG